jgi:hypothetical protein
VLVAVLVAVLVVDTLPSLLQALFLVIHTQSVLVVLVVRLV